MPEFLLKYGYLVVFIVTFVEQIGVPLPAVPILIGVGALCRSGEFSLTGVVAAAAFAALSADLIWYALGRSYGRSVLGLICRIALEPDNCVRRSEDAFERFGLWLLLPAKFVVGFNAAAIPMAGMMKTPFHRFLVFDSFGVVLWGGAYTLLGYAFSREVERVINVFVRMGTSLFILLAAMLGLYVAYKLHQRRRFLAAIAARRITPEELKTKMDAKDSVLIFDVRNRLDRSMDPVRIPGAFHVLPEHVEFQSEDIGANREIVVYCSCPNEATSARVALRLQQMGLKSVRPLRGGLDEWRKLDLPVEALD